MKSITFLIGSDGKVVTEVHGLTGQSCQDFSKEFASLGQVLSEQLKPEYYQEATHQDFVSQQE